MLHFCCFLIFYHDSSTSKTVKHSEVDSENVLFSTVLWSLVLAVQIGKCSL